MNVRPIGINGSESVLLGARGLRVAYGDVEVLRGIDLAVHSGEVVALLGPNGAGKTTLIRALAGYLRPQGGEVMFLGTVADDAPHRRARRGLGFLGEDRHVFPGLTVGENFRLVRDGRRGILSRFPELAARTRSRGALLSGGEQQMLALGRVLAREPRVVLVDELSLGLAPLVRDRLLVMLRGVAHAGRAVLVVEQSARAALAVSDRALVLRRGEIADERAAADWVDNLDELGRLYLG